MIPLKDQEAIRMKFGQELLGRKRERATARPQVEPRDAAAARLRGRDERRRSAGDAERPAGVHVEDVAPYLPGQVAVGAHDVLDVGFAWIPRRSPHD